MKWLLFLSLTGSVLSAMTAETTYYNLNQAEQYFESFLEKYSKDLSRSGGDREKRFNIFKQNLKTINELNALNESLFGITQFSDLTEEEFVQLYSHNPFDDEDDDRKPRCPVVTDDQLKAVNIPGTLDYRTKNVVTAVKDQGRCNSCWAFSSIGAIEGAYAIKHKALLTFSPKQLLDCLPCSTPCDGPGSSMRKALAELWGGGVTLESEYPYSAEKSTCTYKPEQAKARINGCTNFLLTNEEKYKDVLVKYGPMSIGIDVTKLLHYKGGVLTENLCSSGKPNHAVLLVGYGSDSKKDYWLIKDSRGTDYGEAGYIRIERGHNVCGILNRQAVVASVE